jgi:lysyl-tRNA synthetase class II
LELRIILQVQTLVVFVPVMVVTCKSHIGINTPIWLFYMLRRIYMYSEQELIRRETLGELRQMINAYPERYAVNYGLHQVKSLDNGIDGVRVAGRIMSVRKMGKLSFITITDINGNLQLALKEDAVGKEKYDFFHKCFDIGTL